jgi:glycosyltransferase involved in cell wall biosynthesis
VKVLFVLPSLMAGGAQRVVLNILKHIDRDKFELYLLLIKKEDGYDYSMIPSDVKVIDLNLSQARYAIFKIIKIIRELKPNIVFTSLSYVNLLLSVIRGVFPNSIKFVARESNTVSEYNKRDKYPKINDFLYKRFYKNFDLIITQAESMRDDLKENFFIDESKMKIIYNPVDFETIIKRSREDEVKRLSGKVNLLAVGKLEEQKGYDMLLEIMSRVDDNYHLRIVGKGSKEGELKEMIKRLNLENRVEMVGFSNNPYAYMRAADLFLLPSRYEGLPNVVLEANTLGVPVIAFNSAGGTKEIVKDSVNGFLVEPFELDTFAKKIKEAKDYPFDKERISKETIDRFSADVIVKEYEDSFLNLLGTLNAL